MQESDKIRIEFLKRLILYYSHFIRQGLECLDVLVEQLYGDEAVWAVLVKEFEKTDGLQFSERVFSFFIKKIR